MLNDDLLLFSSTALAFKPGGYSMVANNPTQAKFDSETLWANEFGFKAHWLENHLQTHLAFFYYRIDHYQVERLATPVDFTIVNAPKTTSYGLELETAIEIISGLQLETSFGYTHIRFDTFQDPITKKDLSGHSPPLYIKDIFKHKII